MVAVEQDAGELPSGTQVLRRYSVVGKLAQGGMAEVYLARQLGPAGYNKLVVVKRVRPHLANDADFVGMFVNEARLAAMINHPNVVQIFDLGDQPRPASLGGGTDWFLAMEYLDGRDMLQVGRACRSNNKAVPFDVTARIIADACAGLDHAHGLKSPEGKSLDLVHRDMSPENVLITFEGQVKVVDFGIAKASDNLIKTQAGQIKGKLGYVAPEAILGKPVDARADVFAIGATLYLFLSGRPAFSGTNPMEIFERSLKPPVPPREVNNRVPEQLDAICMKALAQDRDKRYRSAGEVRIALEQYLQSTGRPLGPVQLGQFMRILFPPDKDPVRQRIDKLLADSPAQPGPTAPAAVTVPLAPPLPARPPPRSTTPEPVVVEEEDNEKTNIVPARVDQTVPSPVALQKPKPSLPPLPPPSPPASPSPPHLRSVALATAEDSVTKPVPRVPAVGDAPPTLEILRPVLSSADGLTQPGVRPPVPQRAAVPTVEVEVDAVAESIDLDSPTVEVQAVARPGALKNQVDVAASLFESDKTRPIEDLRPPPFEPSGAIQRPPLPGSPAQPTMAPPTAASSSSSSSTAPASSSQSTRLPPPAFAPAAPSQPAPPSAQASPPPAFAVPSSPTSTALAAAPPPSSPPPAFSTSSLAPPAAASPSPSPSPSPPGLVEAAPAVAPLSTAPMPPPPPSAETFSAAPSLVWTGGDANAPLPPVAPLRPRGTPAEGPLPDGAAPSAGDVLVAPPFADAPVGLSAGGDGPGPALKAAMFAFGALTGVVVLFIVLWLTGLGERVFR
jgi:serine/threonine-protein kinase